MRIVGPSSESELSAASIEGNSHEKNVGFMKKSGKPPLFVTPSAVQEQYMLDHLEDLGLRVVDLNKDSFFVAGKLCKWEEEDKALANQRSAEERQRCGAGIALRECMQSCCKNKEAYGNQFQVCSRCKTTVYCGKGKSS